MTGPPGVVALRKPLTPAQRRVLDLIAEAPSYAKMGRSLGISKRTVRARVLEIADLLPTGFVADGQPKERVCLYAMLVFALAQTTPARESAA